MKKRMKKRKRVKVKKGRKIARIFASAEDLELPPELMHKWAGYFRPIKQPVTLRLDADILLWFKKQGRGYQTRINRALREVVRAARKKPGEVRG
jgi:uncharacterized protein (DUF4415 family)